MKRTFAGGLCALVLTSGICLADGPPALRSSSFDAQAQRESRASRAQSDGRHVVALMQDTAHGVAGMLTRARRGTDARATACADASLSQADVLMRRAQDRFALLRAAVDRGDDADVARQLMLLNEDRAFQRDVEKNAAACLGVVAGARTKDVVTVTVTIDKDIAPEPRD